MPLTYRGRALLYDVGLGQRREARRDTTGTSLTRRHKDVVVSGDFAWRGSCFTNDRDRGQGRTLGLRGERERIKLSFRYHKNPSITACTTYFWLIWREFEDKILDESDEKLIVELDDVSPTPHLQLWPVEKLINWSVF